METVNVKYSTSWLGWFNHVSFGLMKEATPKGVVFFLCGIRDPKPEEVTGHPDIGWQDHLPNNIPHPESSRVIELVVLMFTFI